MKNHNNKKGLKWLVYIVLGGFLIKFLRFVFKGDNEKKIAENFKDFFKKEKKEAGELAGGKESFKKYCEDSCSIFKSYFLPAECNDFKPKILRTKSLAIIAVVLLLLKITVAGYLFAVYPSIGKMSQMIHNEIYSLVNSERLNNNIALLGTNNALNQAAKAKARDMIDNNYFAHKTLGGKMIWDMIDRDEYPYLYVGENLAMNFTSAESAHKALMLSPTHKKNILNSKYTEIGLAVASGEINGRQTNVLVEVFGRAKIVQPAIAKADAREAPSAPIANTGAKETERGVNPEQQHANPVESAPASVNNAEPDIKPLITESRVLSAESKTKESKTPANIEQPIIKEYENKRIAKPSPNEELEFLAPINEVNIEIPRQYGTTAKVINYSQYVFIGALILLILLLLVNILVRASIQRKPVIVQTFLLIIFVYGMITVKLHFLESITEKILIM